MSIAVRPVTADEAEGFLRTMSVPFSFDLPEEPERRQARIDRFRRVLEPERTRCAFDGARMVGTLGTLSLQMTVPGGSVPCAGTTMATVLPSHRRQGVLRAMMEAHLQEAREHGDPIAGLWASDSAIYGRFGFGQAAREAEVTVDTAHATFHRLAPEPAPVEMVSASEAADVLPPIYEQLVADRPGSFHRSAEWWELQRLRDDPEHRDGATAYRFAVAGPGSPEGYVQYRVKQSWSEHHGANRLRVVELVATTASAWAGLWRFVLSHDLTATVSASHRPFDDPLFSLLAGPRRAKTEVTDSLWVRIVRVADALAARRYRTPGRLVLEVHDPMGLTGGRFRLDTEGEGVVCDPTEAPPDVTLDIEDLSACFMGWSRFSELARAGRVEASTEALVRADAMFSWDPLPWCPEVF